MDAIALVLPRARARAGRGGRGDGRKDARQVAPDVVVERPEHPRLDPRDERVERIDEDPVGQIALELRRAPVEHRVPALVRPSAELGQQAGLADPRLARELDRGRTPPPELAERLVQRPQLGDTPDKPLALVRHLLLLAASIVEAIGDWVGVAELAGRRAAPDW
jgi:hypothetical protein